MVPLIDLKAQYDSIRDEIRDAVDSVLESRQYILGPQVAEFEQNFAVCAGTSHAVAVNSGTSALHLALLAAGVSPEQEVITVPFTFIASVAAIDYCGARPVFVDIDPQSFTMDVNQVERLITPRTKAILPVHLYGQAADMDPLMDLARRHNLMVIEDAAQAHAAEYKGRRAGSLGHLACFSFYPTKNLGAYGEGGIVTTNDAELAAKVRMLRDWGQDRKYHHVLRGFNYRMEGLQGAILNVKLKHLERWTELRRYAAREYDALLPASGLCLPVAMPYSRHVYHTYTVRSSQRDELQEGLAAAGIQTAIHYAIPAHLQPAYQQFGSGPGSLPEAERAAREVLSLPMYAELSRESIAEVARTITNLRHPLPA
ncbi:MAG TPA: DegT/DnrJ/EryC1/StrS family aminotransferase [Bryobacteraceae bacterium]|nr:DegT/DnrJ/EryC1/StrS family aminotransferase [Bryobacteraceae bacterium]